MQLLPKSLQCGGHLSESLRLSVAPTWSVHVSYDSCTAGRRSKDTLLVILPMLDLYILAPLANWGSNADILRLLRLGKLAPCLRALRESNRPVNRDTGKCDTVQIDPKQPEKTVVSREPVEENIEINPHTFTNQMTEEYKQPCPQLPFLQ